MGEGAGESISGKFDVVLVSDFDFSLFKMDVA
jgi:hypothetical protein